jgi:hypothetical protein
MTAKVFGSAKRGAIAPLDEKPAETGVFSPFGNSVDRFG